MNSPWDVLGLTPGCTQDELRRAYAQLLKQHRPDRDPEGFRRIRNAYEWLRDHWESISIAPTNGVLSPSLETAREDILKQESPETPNETSNTTANLADTAQPSPPLKQKKSLAQRLNILLANPRLRENTAREERVLQYMLNAWRSSPMNENDLDELLVSEIQERPASILPLLDIPEDCVLNIQRDSNDVTVAILHARAKQGNWIHIFSILDALETLIQQTLSPPAILSIIFGAKYIALQDWKRAQEIVDLTYPHLPEHVRGWAYRELDPLIQVGKEMATLSQKNKNIIAHCLASGNANAKDYATRQAFLSVALLKKAPTTKNYLIERFPDFNNILNIKPTPKKIVKKDVWNTPMTAKTWIWLISILTLSMVSQFNSKNTPSVLPAQQRQNEMHRLREYEDYIKEKEKASKKNQQQNNSAPQPNASATDTSNEYKPMGPPAPVPAKPPLTDQPEVPKKE